jgi:hypothetical protein
MHIVPSGRECTVGRTSAEDDREGERIPEDSEAPSRQRMRDTRDSALLAQVDGRWDSWLPAVNQVPAHSGSCPQPIPRLALTPEAHRRDGEPCEHIFLRAPPLRPCSEHCTDPRQDESSTEVPRPLLPEPVSAGARGGGQDREPGASWRGKGEASLQAGQKVTKVGASRL